MCREDESKVVVELPDDDGNLKPTEIDRCLVPLIMALNRGGVRTRGCCCGHGEQRGYIVLADGRELVIFDPSMEDIEAPVARAIGLTGPLWLRLERRKSSSRVGRQPRQAM